ncbi:transporter [Microscilla marina ATCC 23134]|uniref:Transporter n=2 Tax=Microscilla marina TaxID=1027 RepID=A1ZTM9_MICM2|nr:transporter [Microscilla marina ATCC 23134]
MQNGSYDNIIQNTVGSFTGYVQIHQKGYWNEQNIDNSFEWSKQLQQQIRQPEAVTEVVPRLESYALLASTQKSKAGLVLAIDPAKEQALSAPQKKLVQGNYFDKKDEER